MLRRVWLAAWLLLFLPGMAWAACTAGGTSNCTGNENTIATRTFTSGVHSGRHYRIHVPSTGGTPRPLALVLHGGGTCEDDGNNDIRTVANSGTNPIESDGDFLNVIVAYPRSGMQNTGTSTCGDAHPFQWDLGPESNALYGTNTADIAFVNAVVTDIKAVYSVNAAAVAISGHSGGGFIVLRMACGVGLNPHATVLWAVSASLTAGTVSTCTSTVTTRLYLVNGTQDPAIPYVGGSTDCGIGIGSICSNVISIPVLPIGYAAWQVLALGARQGSKAAASWVPTNFNYNSTDKNCFTQVQHVGANVNVVTIGPGIVRRDPATTTPKVDQIPPLQGVGAAQGRCYVDDYASDANDGGGHTWPGTTSTYGIGKQTIFFKLSNTILASVTGG